VFYSEILQSFLEATMTNGGRVQVTLTTLTSATMGCLQMTAMAAVRSVLAGAL
jgi:hypothetical protein